MRKNIFSAILLIALFIFSSVYAEETLTITTYYPSPYGSYNSIFTDKLGVGDNNSDGNHTSADVPATSGDTWIAGKVGIGTMNPLSRLSVGTDGDATAGIYGSGSYYGVVGSGTMGVAGYGSTYGMFGLSSQYGVYGNGGNYGVFGYGTNSGVLGQGGTYGVYGDGVYGVYGSGTNYGVYGVGALYGVYGTSSPYGVVGNGSDTGVYGSGTNYGVHGESNSGTGVYGLSSAALGYGVHAVGGYAVYADGSTIGVFANGNSHGVYAAATSFGVTGNGWCGVQGYGSPYGMGLYGTSDNIGVIGAGGAADFYANNTGYKFPDGSMQTSSADDRIAALDARLTAHGI